MRCPVAASASARSYAALCAEAGGRMEGYLEKKGGFLGAAWQERFFRLNADTHTLDYFDNGAQRGCIDMRGASVQPHADGVFAICGHHLKHTYVLRQRDPTRCAQWLRALCASTADRDDQAGPGSDSSPGSSPTSTETKPQKGLQRDSGWVRIAAEVHRRGRSASSTSSRGSPHGPPRSPAMCGGEGAPDLSQSFTHSETAIAPSPATCCPPGFCHAGKMWKRGGVLGTWNERWCSFDVFAKTLTYYTSEHGPLKGEFDVEGASVEPWEDGVTFTIRGHRWEHTLQCPSSASRALWLAALRPLVQVGPAHCAALARPPPPTSPRRGDGGSDAHFEHCQACSAHFGPALRPRSCLRCQRPFCSKCCVWRHHLPHLPPGEHCRVCAGCHQVLVVVEAEGWERRLVAVRQADEWEALAHLRRWREECLAASHPDLGGA
eukprot:EG_transcript_9815